MPIWSVIYVQFSRFTKKDLSSISERIVKSHYFLSLLITNQNTKVTTNSFGLFRVGRCEGLVGVGFKTLIYI